MRNNQGIGGGASFFSGQTFDTLIRIEIDKLQPCALKCIEQSKDILVDLTTQVKVPELVRFSNLSENIHSIAAEIINQKAQETAEFTKQLINIQKSFINLKHPDFATKGFDLSSFDPSNVDQLIELVHRYYVIVRKEVSDSIPKAIFRSLIHSSLYDLRFVLVKRLVLNPERIENPLISEKRPNCI
jgi:hypothetical protein